MTFDELLKLVNPIAIAVSGVLNVYLFLKSKTDQRFEDIVERIESVEAAAEDDREMVRLAIAERKAHVSELTERVSIIDTHVRQLPTHQDINSINNKLSQVEERSRILLDGMRRIEQHLLDH